MKFFISSLFISLFLVFIILISIEAFTKAQGISYRPSITLKNINLKLIDLFEYIGYRIADGGSFLAVIWFNLRDFLIKHLYPAIVDVLFPLFGIFVSPICTLSGYLDRMKEIATYYTAHLHIDSQFASFNWYSLLIVVGTIIFLITAIRLSRYLAKKYLKSNSRILYYIEYVYNIPYRFYLYANEIWFGDQRPINNNKKNTTKT